MKLNFINVHISLLYVNVIQLFIYLLILIYLFLQGQTECQIFLNKNIEIISNVAHLYPGIAIPVVSIL